MKGAGPNLENFILNYFSLDWEDLLKIDELNADKSTKIYLDKINMLLEGLDIKFHLYLLIFSRGA